VFIEFAKKLGKERNGINRQLLTEKEHVLLILFLFFERKKKMNLQLASELLKLFVINKLYMSTLT
jgi:hypothetical protein